MTDVFWTVVGGGIVTAIPIVTGQVLTYLGSRRQRDAIAQRADVKMDGIAEQGKEIHRVMNGVNTALATKNVELATEVAQVKQDKADIIRIASAAPIDMTAVSQTGEHDKP